ncbi:MAG: hypothetical protein ABIE23_06400 [archaeon]
MPKRKPKKPLEGKSGSKPEDKDWKGWYNKLTPKDHEQILAKLGISKKDKEELQQELEKENAETEE